MRNLLERLEERRRSTKKASIDAIVTFKHKGKRVTAKVARTQWRGGKSMLYVWRTTDGKEIETDGVPKGAKVISDVPGPVT